MASHVARSARNYEVRKRLDVAFAGIAERLGIEIPPEPRRTQDPGLQPIVELERFADFAERVLGAIGGAPDAGDGDPKGDDDAEESGYATRTVAQLRALLTARDVEIPQDARKADLVALMEAADVGDGEPAEDDEPEGDVQP